MSRSGTLIVTGAGASVEAGYPTAAGLLEPFRAAVKQASEREVSERETVRREMAELQQKAANPPPGQFIWVPEFKPQPTTGEWFERKWEAFVKVSARLRALAVPKLGADGKPDLNSAVIYGPDGAPSFTDYAAPMEQQPSGTAGMQYLENFFAFYDDTMRPIIAAIQGDPGALATSHNRFRHLRQLAVESAVRLLSAYGRSPARYIGRLFQVRGPLGHQCAIATLNFDVSIEHAASTSGFKLCDGFGERLGSVSGPPPEWTQPGLENLDKLWNAVAANCQSYVGFESTPEKTGLLLKLHGSLGWYTIEEGGGDIGFRDELRHNTVYEHVRVPYEMFWSAEMHPLITELALGGSSDPVTRTPDGSRSRKAGAVWVRPYLIFARAMKTHPDRLSLDLMATFARLLRASSAILVVGYSWGDPHINDLIFDAVAQGATLINVSRAALPEPVAALWMQRFATTFHVLRKRLFMFGGGARSAIEDGVVELPGGQRVELDLIGALPDRIPTELSLLSLPCAQP